jgi:hypothetical protein
MDAYADAHWMDDRHLDASDLTAGPPDTMLR